MNIATLSPLLVLALTLPALDMSNAAAPLPSNAPTCAEIDLGAMRAGATRSIEPLTDQWRAELVEAADESHTDMRAGSAPTDREWGWIGIGVVAVLLIIVLL